MRDPGSYRGARRDEARSAWHNLRRGIHGSMGKLEVARLRLSFVDLWREEMPKDGAAEYRSADWKRYTDKEARHARTA